MIPPGWRLRELASAPSTSALLVQLATAGEPGRLAVRTDRQTAGRGSRGRAWTSPPGALALSVLLRPGGRAGDAGQWALMAAVVLADALGPAARVKWPNDVLLDDKKLGGVLIDTALDVSGRLEWLVIGFGANLGAVPEIGRPTAVVAGDPAVVAAAVLAGLDRWDRIRLLGGFAPVRQAWRDRGPALGAPLRVRQGSREVAGTFAGLDDDGALLLQGAGRVHAILTGETLLAGDA